MKGGVIRNLLLTSESYGGTYADIQKIIKT